MAVKGKAKTPPAKKGRTRSETPKDKQIASSSEDQQTTLIPEIEHPITVEHEKQPSIRLKGKIRSVKEGKANISIRDDEWDTFYFED